MKLYTKLRAKAEAVDWARLGAISGLVLALIVAMSMHLLLGGCSGPVYYGGPVDANLWTYHAAYGGSQRLACTYFVQFSPVIKDRLDRARNKLEYSSVINEAAEQMHGCMEQAVDAYLLAPVPPYTYAIDYAGLCIAMLWPEE